MHQNGQNAQQPIKPSTTVPSGAPIAAQSAKTKVTNGGQKRGNFFMTKQKLPAKNPTTKRTDSDEKITSGSESIIAMQPEHT